MIKVQILETEKQNYAECVNSERHASYHHLLGHPVLTQHGNNTLPLHPVLTQHGNSTLPHHNVLHNTAKTHHQPTLFWHNMATAHYRIIMFYTTWQQHIITPPCSGTKWQQHISTPSHFTQHDNTAPIHWTLKSKNKPIHPVSCSMATTHTTQCCDPKQLQDITNPPSSHHLMTLYSKITLPLHLCLNKKWTPPPPTHTHLRQHGNNRPPPQHMATIDHHSISNLTQHGNNRSPFHFCFNMTQQ